MIMFFLEEMTRLYTMFTVPIVTTSESGEFISQEYLWIDDDAFTLYQAYSKLYQEALTRHFQEELKRRNIITSVLS